MCCATPLFDIFFQNTSGCGVPPILHCNCTLEPAIAIVSFGACIMYGRTI